VDTGDLLYSVAGTHSPNARKIGELRAELYMKAYNLMGYDAFTPGELDFAFGVEPIIAMRKQANFPFLLANLVEGSSNQPVFAPYIIKNLHGLRIGLVGLISRQVSLGGSAEEKGKYLLLDPVETVKKLVAELAKKNCQAIAVLAHMDLDQQEKLGSSVPGVHFIFSGHYSYYQPDPITVNGTTIFFAGSRGENMGQVDFFRDQKELNARFSLVPLRPQYPDHPETHELLQQYKTSLQSFVQSQARTAPGVTPRTSRGHVIVPVSPAYVGEKNCLPCHLKQHQQWTTTAHARAYQTLTNQGKADDPLCLVCHTTGFGAGQTGGGMKDVQCEACHGAAEGHPAMGRSMERVSETACTRCHNSANSPNFNYQVYLQKVIHQK